MTAPVLVIAYRRPDHVASVMQAVSVARPSRLYLACDGPNARRPGEKDLVEATRNAMEQAIDWNCTVERLYAEENQGCRLGVRRAIDWFFDHVDEGIILEDDCVPHPDFFPFCTELLSRYRTDERVMHISGDGSLRHEGGRRDASYVFSRESLVWGWASWRRAWHRYDADLLLWKGMRNDATQLAHIFDSNDIAQFWSNTLNRLLDLGEPDTWDYQWSFSVLAREGLAVVPRVNLITNTGHGVGATHTFDTSSSRANVATGAILPLVHPPRVQTRKFADRRFQRRLRGLGRLKKVTKRVRKLGKRTHRYAVSVAGAVVRRVR